MPGLDVPPVDRQPGPAQVALKGLCPRCGAPTLFASMIGFAPTCGACGLDFTRFNVGDGPAALLILVLGAIVVGAAIGLELAVSPPFWVHLIWVPVSAVAVVASLRVSKAALLALEYRNKAGEARNEDRR